MKNNLIVVAVASVLVLAQSCKRYIDPPPIFEDGKAQAQDSSIGRRRVLLIAIDGAPAGVIKEMKLPKLEEIRQHSKFSWDCTSDERTADATVWKTLMSSKPYEKHRIFDSSFIYSRVNTNDGIKDNYRHYPSMFHFIVNSPRPDLKTTFISPWPTLVRNLVPEVRDQVVVADDLAAKNAAVEKLQKANPELMVVNFNSMAIAGKAGSFSASNTLFADAAKKVDGYIGDILAALKSRPEYNKKEEWLVIVTATHGGSGDNYGGNSKEEVEVFTFYYNEGFKPIEVSKQGALVGVRMNFDNDMVRAVTTSNSNIPNPGEKGKGDVTYQLTLRGQLINPPANFFYKISDVGLGIFNDLSKGFSNYAESKKNWCLMLRGSNNNNSVFFNAANNVVFDGKWHTIAFTISDSNNLRYCKRYVDGVKLDERDITNLGGIYSPEPMTIGFGKSYVISQPNDQYVDFTALDLKIFNVALSSDEIRATNCLADITKHPKYSNMVCYWPLADGFGSVLKSRVAGVPNFELTGSYLWRSLIDGASRPCTHPAPQITNNDQLVSIESKLVDISPNIFYWLNIPIKDEWGFEGKVWLERFVGEFIK